MKKASFCIGALALLVVIAVGCNNVVKGADNTPVYSEEVQKVIQQYHGIGEEHNKLLSDFYFGNDSLRSVAVPSSGDYKSLSVEEYFGKFEKAYYFDSMDDAARSAVGTGMTTQMVEKELISSGAAQYIAQIESILNTPLDSLEATQDAITAVEAQAIPQLSDGDLDQFMSYAETAKASLEFWTDNYTVLSGENDEESARFFSWIRRKWNQYKNKLAMMAASDAAGAAAGAAVGAKLGAAIGGVGAGPGAAIGAAVCGGASSIEGFKTGKLCIVISLDKIKREM